MKRMKLKFRANCLSKLLLLLGVCMNFFACEKEESTSSENSKNGNWAPESVAMKEFVFYKENKDMWSFKVFFGDKVAIITSSNYFVVDECDASYERNGENTALFDCYYLATGKIIQNIISTSWNQYDIQLTYLSAHHGKYTGKYRDTPLSNNWKTVTGMFVYDSDKDISHFVPQLGNGGQDDKDNDNSSSSSDNNNDKKEQFSMSDPTIKDLGTTSAVIKSTVVVENLKVEQRGICYSTKKTPTINDQCVNQNTNVAELTLPDLTPNTTYYVRSFAKINGKVQYTSQLSFTTNDLYIETLSVYSNEIKFILNYKDPNMYKGTGYTKVKAGLCYGTTPHPTVEKDKVAGMEAIDPDDDTLERVSMNPSTHYYLRPYSIDNNKVTYYQETEMTTVGSDLILKIEHEKGDKNIKCYADVNKGGPYDVKLKISNGKTTTIPFDFGTLDSKSPAKQFGFEVKTMKIFGDIAYLYIVAVDKKTGYKYFSNYFYKRDIK